MSKFKLAENELYLGLLQQESKQYTSVHHSKPNSGMDTIAEEGVEDEAAGSNRDLRDWIVMSVSTYNRFNQIE